MTKRNYVSINIGMLRLRPFLTSSTCALKREGG